MNHAEAIRFHMAVLGVAAAPPARHVEAWMRLARPSLDDLSPDEFQREVSVGAECAQYDPAMSERLAHSVMQS